MSRDTLLLDALSANETPYRGQVTLRWIMVDMLEETARHAGHLDLYARTSTASWRLVTQLSDRSASGWAPVRRFSGTFRHEGQLDNDSSQIVFDNMQIWLLFPSSWKRRPS